MYLTKLLNQIHIWKEVKKIVNEPLVKKEIDENGFRIDWIGRLYTVIHLPEEVMNSHEQIQQMYVLNKLRDFDEMFLRMGIADVVAPEFQQIDNENYLLIICPDYDTFKWWKLLLFFSGIIGIIVGGIYLIGLL